MPSYELVETYYYPTTKIICKPKIYPINISDNKGLECPSGVLLHKIKDWMYLVYDNDNRWVYKESTTHSDLKFLHIATKYYHHLELKNSNVLKELYDEGIRVIRVKKSFEYAKKKATKVSQETLKKYKDYAKLSNIEQIKLLKKTAREINEVHFREPISPTGL